MREERIDGADAVESAAPQVQEGPICKAPMSGATFGSLLISTRLILCDISYKSYQLTEQLLQTGP